MRIAILGLYTTPGGIGSSFEDLVRALAERHSIVAITSHISKLRDSENVEVLRLNYDKKRPWTLLKPTNIFNITIALWRRKPDVIFNYIPHIANGLASLSCIVPQITWIHEPELRQGSSFNILASLLQKLMILRSKKIIVAGKYLWNLIVKKIAINPSRVDILPFWLLSEFADAISNLDTNSKPVQDFLYFGRIDRYKGLDVLANALQYIYRIYGYRLTGTIIGSGPLNIHAPELIALSRRTSTLKIHNTFASPNEIMRQLLRSKFMILPYKTATASHAIPIAYACRRPIIATGVGTFPEYVLSGITGLVIEADSPDKLGEAMMRLSKNDDLCMRLGIAGYNFLQTTLSFEKIIKTLERVLETEVKKLA